MRLFRLEFDTKKPLTSIFKRQRIENFMHLIAVTLPKASRFMAVYSTCRIIIKTCAEVNLRRLLIINSLII